MLSPKRQQRISDYLLTHTSASVVELSHALNVSPSTVRRDLEEMEDGGLLRRVHGGAVLKNGRERNEPPILQRATQQAEAKRRIGEAAARLVQDGSTIIITSGSTTEAMIPFLADKKNLTVVTNAVNIAHQLTQYPSIAVMVLGGWLRHSELSLLGHPTMQALQDLRADKVFHGTFAIDPERGLDGSYLREVETDRRIIAAARELIVLADHTKFGQVGSVRLMPIESVSTVVTDTEAPPDAVQALQARGITVIQA